MISHSQFGSPSFKLAAKGLVALHGLIKDGKVDSPQAESIRDALDAPLNALNRIEEERAQWLSEDLYSVSEPPLPATQKGMNPQAQQQLIEAIEARESREWDRALALLRRWSNYISPAQLSYLRGSIWLEAGNPDVAAAFYKDASDREPTNANYRAIYMHVLVQSDPNSADKLARDVLAHTEEHAPVVVAQAADIRFHETKTASDGESVQLYRELIPILERNMARIESSEGKESAYAMTVGLLGFCYEFLDNAGSAVNYYTRGLQVNPDNDALLVARGILLYGSSPRAVADLERATALRFPLVWPYLFLAHHYLIENRYDLCRGMCEMGLTMRGSDAAKSQLEEWRAVAQAELGFPPEAVRAAFEAAIRLDPSNELAKRNQDVFEASPIVPHTSLRSKWEQKSEVALRQFGLVERRYPLAA